MKPESSNKTDNVQFTVEKCHFFFECIKRLGASNFNFLFLFGILAAVTQSLIAGQPDDQCLSGQGIQPICKVHNPEDLMVIPGTSKLIISQIGHVTEAPGSLVLLDAETEEVSLLYPASEQQLLQKDLPLWGEKSCTKPPIDFSPIGIGMTRQSDGQLMLLVAIFGSEKSIQMFAVHENDTKVSVQWRGCVKAPPHSFFGDVAGLPGGGFVATASTPSKEDWGKFVHQVDWSKARGMLLSWSPETADKGLIESVVHSPPFNSVEVSKDGKVAYATKVAWDVGGVYKFSIETGEYLGRSAVVNADNIAWDEEGYLLTVSPVTVGWEHTVACGQNSHKHCPIPTTVTRINPNNMQAELIFAHDGKRIFGGGTGAAQLGNYLYLGATAGDRIARIPYAKESIEKFEK